MVVSEITIVYNSTNAMGKNQCKKMRIGYTIPGAMSSGINGPISQNGSEYDSMAIQPIQQRI